MAEIGLFEAMYTARALRRYKPDPIPDEIITKILDAAIRAPSGSNNQNWVFLVVKDAAKRRRIGEVYRKGAEILQSLYANRPRPPHMSEKDYQLLLNSATYLFEHLHEAPVHLFACLRDERTRFGDLSKLPQDIQSRLGALGRSAGSSIYPAVQNIILACRAFGLGTVLTTLHLFHEKEIRELLAIPDDVNTYALLPIGYPINKFGPVKRRPLNEVACLDTFGNNWKG
jgi:nitroreductase